MSRVFEHYSEGVARYLAGGFSFQSEGRHLRFDGLRQRHDLHDALAETFRRAFEPRARLAYEGLAPYEGYLRRIARNLVIDRLRSKSSKWTVLDEDPQVAQESDPTTLASPERAYQQTELSRLMGLFLDTLEPTERQFVMLRYQQDHSQEDVARAMNKTRRWVRSLEVNVKRRLVRYMRGSGYLPAVEASSAVPSGKRHPESTA